MKKEPTQKCQNCNTKLKGKFCYSCGQKVLEPSERTLKHIIFQFFGSAFFLENNFLKNLWNLAVRPGRLALDFIEGRRKRWMPPFSLFLLINLFYFWYVHLTDLNLSLREQMGQPHHAPVARYLVDKKLKSEDITLQEYTDRYDRKSAGYSNSLIILHTPVFALLLSLIFFRNRYFFVDHFVTGIYMFAFMLLTHLMIYYSLFLFFPQVTQYPRSPALIVIIAHFAFVIRRVYKRKWWASLPLAGIVFGCFILTHAAYRTILFLIIYSVT